MNWSKRNTWIFITLAVLCAVTLGNHFFDAYQMTREIDDLRNAAVASHPDTPEDAYRWLGQNGFDVVNWNPRDSRGFVGREEADDGIHLIVTGQRRRQYRNGGHCRHSDPNKILPFFASVGYNGTRDRAFPLHGVCNAGQNACASNSLDIRVLGGPQTPA